MRRFALAAAAIAVAGAAAILLLWRIDASRVSPPTPASGAGAAAGVATAGTPTAGIVAAAPSGEAARVGAPPLVTEARIRAQPSAAASVDWSGVPAASKFADLGRDLARPARDALETARDQMQSCFDDEAERLRTRPVHSGGHEGPAVLVLQLESRDGGLDVVGTEIESTGDSSPELVRCARDVLQGWPIAAPGAAPGRRYRLKLVLQ